MCRTLFELIMAYSNSKHFYDNSFYFHDKYNQHNNHLLGIIVSQSVIHYTILDQSFQILLSWIEVHGQTIRVGRYVFKFIVYWNNLPVSVEKQLPKCK